ncbi:cyclic nucleotide-binding domain-containing protein [bacterium]|nr:cyclic nucleotide-binding domain-containing protein [bacterium]
MNVELIRQVPLFAELTEPDQRLIGDSFRTESRPRGAVIYSSGERANTLFLVESGYVRLMSDQGMTLATLGPGSLLSEAEFLQGAEYQMGAVAAADVSLLALSDDALRRLIQKHPQVGVTLSLSYGEQLVQMEDYLTDRLARTELLGDLPASVLRPLASRLRPFELDAGEPLYQVGENPQGFFLLERGDLAVRSEADGDESRTVPAGEILGALPLLTHKPYTEVAWALEPSLVWVVPLSEFYQISSLYPAVRRTMGRRLRGSLGPADQTQAVIRLAQTPIFATMGAQNLHAIAQRLVLQHVPGGEMIYQAGGSGDALYLVDEGEVELSTETATGVIQEVDRIGPGRYFGEMSLLTGRNRVNDATAVHDTNLWVLYKADLDELVSLYPSIGAALNLVVASQLAAQEEVVDEGRYRRFPLFANLSTRDLREVVQYLRPTRYRSGEQVFRAGAPGDVLYLIERGFVRMQPLGGGPGWTLAEGETFGERAILSNQLHGHTAYADTEIDLLTLDREDLEGLMMRIPGLAMSMSRLISQRSGGGETMRVEEVDEGQPSGAMTISSQRRRAASRQPAPERQRLSVGEWFSGLSTGAKLRLVLLVLILTYLFTVAAWASLNALLNGPTVAAGDSTVVSASIFNAFQGSSEVSSALASNPNAVAEVAMAGQSDAFATPTYTPFPTETPIPTLTHTPTATPTVTPIPPTPTFTPVPPTPVIARVVQQVEVQPEPVEPEVRQAVAAPPRGWDGRIDQLGVSVAEAGVPSGQPYWRLIDVRWENEQEAGGKHHVYVEVLDENGQRIVGQPVTIFWPGGGDTIQTENKPSPEYASNYPMFKAGNSYNAKVEGLPSDVVQGMGLGTPDLPFHTIHTNFLLTFQRTVAP